MIQRLKTRIFFLFLICNLIFISWKKESVFISGEKTKDVSIGIGEITVPVSWKNITTPLPDESKFLAPQYLVDGKDTFMFGNFPSKAVYYIDSMLTSYDSIIKVDPETKTHCRENFMTADSTFRLYYKYPCKNSLGRVYAEIDVMPESPYGVKNKEMQSTKVTPTKAIEIINVLKTFRPNN